MQGWSGWIVLGCDCPVPKAGPEKRDRDISLSSLLVSFRNGLSGNHLVVLNS